MTDSAWVARAKSPAKKTARAYVEYVGIAVGVLWIAAAVAYVAWWAWNNPGMAAVTLVCLVVFCFVFWITDDA